MKHLFEKKDIQVDEVFLNKFAKMYLALRNESKTEITSITQSTVFNSTGFNVEELKEIIEKNSVAVDEARLAGNTPSALTDIYRSDLGELLMTAYFEEDCHYKFKIPQKNISFRELRDLPGRGLDAIGYAIIGSTIHLLIAEAKVSHERKNPPQVVHKASDSIYKSQLSKRQRKEILIERLTNYFKRLSFDDAAVIGTLIMAISCDNDEVYEITFGCTLIRDHTCVHDPKDYGKVKSEVMKFERHIVCFPILSFSDKTISEATDLFYKKVQELAA